MVHLELCDDIMHNIEQFAMTSQIKWVIKWY